jgi:hypothetical protein
MAESAVPTVETDRISVQHSLHDGGDRRQTGFHQQVKIYGDQRSRVAGGFRFRRDVGQPLDEVIAFVAVAEDRTSFDAPDDNVVHCTGST